MLGGLAHISATLDPDGTIRYLNELDMLTFGDRHGDAEGRTRCDRVATPLTAAPFKVRRSEHVLQDMWEKFVLITAGAAITCLMRAHRRHPHRSRR